jgi:hypothetical protein
MGPEPHDEPSAFATATRSRALLARFIESAGSSPAGLASWTELSDSLATLEQAANHARAASADWLTKAALARAEQRADLVNAAERRAALAEQEFAEYLSEIARIWDFLENGAQEPVGLRAATTAAKEPSVPTQHG